MSEVEMALEADEGGQVPRHFSFARCFRIIGIFDDLSDRFYRMAGAQFSISKYSPFSRRHCTEQSAVPITDPGTNLVAYTTRTPE